LPADRSVPYNVDNLAGTLGTFEQAVLLSLVQPRTPLGGERYGRAVFKEVQHRLQRDVSAGAVYATLDRLEAKGLVSSWVAPGSASRGGRPRRHYVVEPKALRALQASRVATDRLWAGVHLPMKGSA
jgi:PadR family transcriptional regulator PadR